MCLLCPSNPPFPEPIMKFPSLPLLALALFQMTPFTASQAGERDTLGPTLAWTLPALGTVATSEKVTFSGTAQDQKQLGTPTTTPGTGTGTGTATTATVDLAGLERVEYRVQGSKKWHSAILIPGATTGTGATATSGPDTWAFTLKLKRGSNLNISVRAVDKNGNESDTIMRRIKRTRTNR
jgi:hypothetical protein